MLHGNLVALGWHGVASATVKSFEAAKSWGTEGVCRVFRSLLKCLEKGGVVMVAGTEWSLEGKLELYRCLISDSNTDFLPYCHVKSYHKHGSSPDRGHGDELRWSHSRFTFQIPFPPMCGEVE